MKTVIKIQDRPHYLRYMFPHRFKVEAAVYIVDQNIGGKFEMMIVEFLIILVIAIGTAGFILLELLHMTADQETESIRERIIDPIEEERSEDHFNISPRLAD